MSQQKIKTLVDDLMNKHVLKVPIDVKQLAYRLGIEVKEYGFDKDLSGYALHKDESKFIGVNSNEGGQRQRFTIAHELGHLLLHQNQRLNVDKNVMMLRGSHSSSGTDVKEIQANRFAAELLMPETELRKDLTKIGGIELVRIPDDTRDSDITELANKYDVSYQAMSIRLANLYFN